MLTVLFVQHHHHWLGLPSGFSLGMVKSKLYLGRILILLFCRSGEGWLSFAACSADEECPGYYLDFAGSGVVHLLGAGCSIMGCYFMGARRGRFNKKGDPIDMPGHSVPLAGLGGFILIFGFLAFNGGSQTTISNEGDGGVVALAIVNTILGASTGGLSVLFLTKV